MACGLPVIGTDVTGTREVIQHKGNGYLCPTSPEGLLHAITEVLSDESLRKRIGKNARDYVVENFSLAKIVEREIALIEELVV